MDVGRRRLANACGSPRLHAGMHSGNCRMQVQAEPLRLIGVLIRDANTTQDKGTNSMITPETGRIILWTIDG